METLPPPTHEMQMTAIRVDIVDGKIVLHGYPVKLDASLAFFVASELLNAIRRTGVYTLAPRPILG